MTLKLHRLWASLVLILIIIYGVLKIIVLRLYADSIRWLIDQLNLPAANLMSFFEKQGNHEDMARYSAGWIIYYPTYLLLHILFIHLLFHQNKRLKFILSIGLTILILSLVALWYIFLKAGYSELSTFFRTMFYNLFGLPFILLAIEGGRILYEDLSKTLNE